MDKGFFITVEGIDGCGKTSLLQRLAERLRNTCNVVITKEPGGSSLGSHLRAILQEQPEPLDHKAEFLLFAADRAHHFTKLVLPALHEGSLVLADRCADSSIAYQGYGHQLSVSMLQQVNSWAMQNRQPDITLYVAITPEIAAQRLAQRGVQKTAFEKRDTAYWSRVIAGYEWLCTTEHRFIIIDGNQSRDAVFAQACSQIVAHTQRHSWHQTLQQALR